MKRKVKPLLTLSLSLLLFLDIFKKTLFPEGRVMGGNGLALGTDLEWKLLFSCRGSLDNKDVPGKCGWIFVEETDLSISESLMIIGNSHPSTLRSLGVTSFSHLDKVDKLLVIHDA